MSQISAGTPDDAHLLRKAHAVDNTDWLKTAATIFVLVDHIGHFFMEDDRWWAVVGRLAAPTFCFLMGYARTRNVPLHWIWIGVVLTVLNSWNAGWTWVAPNILLSLALIRSARPYVETFVQKYGWRGFAILVCVLVVALPIASKAVDYGAEAWLWGLLGLCQRRFVDSGSAANDQSSLTSARMMPLLACVIAALVYVWQEEREFSFPHVHFAVFVVGIAALSVALCLFRRGPSRIQVSEPAAGVIRFIGRHTLEIYAIQLAGSEILVKLAPDLTA